ncbi:MAG: hypothetical protein ACYDDF_11605 [Thermoplasmatota archaeon]
MSAPGEERLLVALSDRECFERVLERAFGLSEADARSISARVFYYYMDPWGSLTDCVVDEGDSTVFTREDRRDLVALGKLNLVKVCTTDVTKRDGCGRVRSFRQYRYALDLESIRQHLIAAVAPPAPTNEGDVYDDPSLWNRKRS